MLTQIHLMTGTACEFQGTDVFMMEYIHQDSVSQDTHTWYSLPARPHCKSVIQPAYLLQPAPPLPFPCPSPTPSQLVVCTTDLDSSVSDNTHSFHLAQSVRSIIAEGEGQLILVWKRGVRFLGGPGNFLLIFFFLSSSLTVAADDGTIWKTTVLRMFRGNILPLSSGSNLVQQAINHVTDAGSEWPPACSLTVCSSQSLQQRPTYNTFSVVRTGLKELYSLSSVIKPLIQWADRTKSAIQYHLVLVLEAWLLRLSWNYTPWCVSTRTFS